MSRDTSIVLEGHLARFVERQVEHGHFASASDVVRAGLQLLEEQETKLGALRGALIEGEASGDYAEFDVEAFLAEKRQTIGR